MTTISLFSQFSPASQVDELACGRVAVAGATHRAATKKTGADRFPSGLGSLILRVIALPLLLLVSLQAAAEIHKWTDANGRVHYGDIAPADVQVETIEGDVNTYEKQTYDFLPPPQAAEAEKPKVIMYATSWCPYCRKAREYFKSQGIAYTEYDIEKNAAAKQKYDALGGQGVPLILVGDKKMAGFSAENFASLYGG